MRRILAIDGGGIRGVVPATVLAEIERRTERSVADLFDLVTGTSTGGLLALGLAKPSADGTPEYTAAELMDLYSKEGAAIFHRDLWYRLTAAENVLDPKYPSAGIDRVLEKYFGESMLTDALTDILVTSYDIEHRVPFFFRRDRARKNDQWNWLMRDAVRATSAAPTYFEPARLPVAGTDDYYALVDGGVFANNPAMCAYVEARRLWEAEEQFLVVSLGTGELCRPIPYDQAKDWGLARWAQPILGVVFDGVSDTVDFQLRDLCLDDKTRVSSYFRLQVKLDQMGSDDLDNATRSNLAVLKTLAQNLIDDKDAEIDQICKLLVE